MDVTAERNNDVLSLAVTGRIDTTTAADFRERIDHAIAETDRAVLLDFTEVEYIGSAGLRVILLKAKDLQPRGVELALCALTPPVRGVFKVTGFDLVMNIHDTAAEARAALDADAAQTPGARGRPAR